MENFQMTQVQKRPIMAQELHALRAIDKANAELMERNAIRVAKIKEQMGAKYVLHPANSPLKQTVQRVLK